MPTLRDEILVVSRYEKSARSGFDLLRKVRKFRARCGDRRPVLETEFAGTILSMTEEGVFNPWVKLRAPKGLEQVEDIDEYDPLYTIFFQLTYRGHLEHFEAVDRIAEERGDFRKLLSKKPGQSK